MSAQHVSFFPKRGRSFQKKSGPECRPYFSGFLSFHDEFVFIENIDELKIKSCLSEPWSYHFPIPPPQELTFQKLIDETSKIHTGPHNYIALIDVQELNNLYKPSFLILLTFIRIKI